MTCRISISFACPEMESARSEYVSWRKKGIPATLLLYWSAPLSASTSLANGDPQIERRNDSDALADTEPKARSPADLPEPVTVRLKPSIYQLGKAKMDELVKIDATPEQMPRAVLQPARIVKAPDA